MIQPLMVLNTQRTSDTSPALTGLLAQWGCRQSNKQLTWAPAGSSAI